MKPTIHFAIETALAILTRGVRIEIRRASTKDIGANQLLYTFTVTDLTWSLPSPWKRGRITATGEATREADLITIRHTMFRDLVVAVPGTTGETILPALSLEHMPLERS